MFYACDLFGQHKISFLMQVFHNTSFMLDVSKDLTVCLIVVDMNDIRSFAKNQGAVEADDLSHWDVNFWSERLRESKFDINEVASTFMCIRF